jgi:hypothetical protein
MAAVDTSFIPSLNEPSDQTPGVIPECPTDYPPLSAFVWPTDEDDEVILSCTTSSTLAPTTLAPTTTPPVNPGTPAPTDAITDEPTTADATPMTTSEPTTTSVGNIQTDQPTMASTTSTTSEPTTSFDPSPTTGQVQESCMLNPSCAAQNALRAAGIESCCPTRDERNLYLDCCAAVEDFCFDEAGSLTVCQSISTMQYVNEVLTGQRDPNSITVGGGGDSSAPGRTGDFVTQIWFCLLGLSLVWTLL